jgi:hypothetical protein
MDRPRHLAQANVARQRAPLDSPVMGEFALALDPVYRIAEGSPGFVWRLVSGERHGVAVVEDGVPLTVNLSVWESYAALHAFVYRSPHGGYVRRRDRWFEPVAQPSTVLWWVEAADRGGGAAPAPPPAGPWAVAAGVHPAAAVRPRRAARGPAGPTGLEGG